MSQARKLLLALTISLVAVAPLAASAQAKVPDNPPQRVLIIVLDQFRPDYVDTFDMRTSRR